MNLTANVAAATLLVLSFVISAAFAKETKDAGKVLVAYSYAPAEHCKSLDPNLTIMLDEAFARVKHEFEAELVKFIDSAEFPTTWPKTSKCARRNWRQLQIWKQNSRNAKCLRGWSEVRFTCTL